MKSQRLLSNAEIASFCSQTAMILNAGITPYEGMSILMQDTKDEKGKALVNTIIESLGQGETFYKALGETDVFPDYVLHMVELGEQSGNLDNVMQSLARGHDSRQHQIRSKISSYHDWHDASCNLCAPYQSTSDFQSGIRAVRK